MFRWLLWLRDQRSQLWFSSAVAGVLATALAMVATLANRVVDPALVPSVSPDVVETLINVIASSMLAVVTFSLGTMVAAFSSASSGATPRAAAIVMRDPGAHRAIASFLAAFIYAIVAKVALALQFYGPVGRFVLLLGTLVVLAYLIVRLVLWVRSLTRLGRLSDTLEKTADVADKALARYVEDPWMGSQPGPADRALGVLIHPDRAGYLVAVDFESLQRQAEQTGKVIHVLTRPGQFVAPSIPVAHIEGQDCEVDGPALAEILDAFVVSSWRSLDDDPRYAVVVMSEIAQRALSPAINDPGTAIQTATAMAALLVRRFPRSPRESATNNSKGESSTVRYPDVTVIPLDEAGLVRDAFDPIARDGAAVFEVHCRLQKLLAVVHADCSEPLAASARKVASRALKRSLAALQLEEERDELMNLHRASFADEDGPGARQEASNR